MSGRKVVKCPKCGAEDVHPTYIHNWGQLYCIVEEETIEARVFGFGWECIRCGHKWGYDVE